MFHLVLNNSFLMRLNLMRKYLIYELNLLIFLYYFFILVQFALEKEKAFYQELENLNLN